MLIERSLLNLLSICRVIRHKSLSIEFMPMQPFRKFLLLVLNQLSRVEMGSGWNWWLGKAKWLHNRKSAKTSCNAQFVREMWKGNILNLFFPGYCFSLAIWCTRSENQEQFWAENCQTWYLIPDFPLKMQPTFGIKTKQNWERGIKKKKGKKG